MHIFVKLHGFKAFSKPIAIEVEPCNAISTIARKLQDISGAQAERLTMLSGLSVSNPSGSFRKLDHGATIADQGLCDGSTLMAFVPGGQLDAQASAPQFKRRIVCVGRVHYRPSPSQPLKSGEIIAATGSCSRSSTTLLYEGVEYANAQEWVAKVFNNSGRSCALQFERAQEVSTPRPTRYVPPTAQCPFGRYL